MVKRARMVVALALLLTLIVVGTGCVTNPIEGSRQSREAVDMSDEVTERDVAMAEQLDAPASVTEALAKGEWDSIVSRRTIRDAEAAEDYLSARYGVEFRATKVAQHGGPKTNTDLVTLTVSSGPFEGEECVCSLYAYGTPEWADSYLYVRLHTEYEDVVRGVAESAFSDLPEGTWACRAAMDCGPYYEVMDDVRNEGQTVTLAPDVSLAEAGPYIDGRVWVYVSPDSTISEEDYQRRAQEIEAALEKTGVCCHWRVCKVTKPLDGAEFTVEWAVDAVEQSEFTWDTAGYVLGVN